jgi:predicted nuclease of predicted toxin-antitoxin system
VTAFLIDEMFPPATAAILRDSFHRDAIHVGEVGLLATADTQVGRSTGGPSGEMSRQLVPS